VKLSKVDAALLPAPHRRTQMNEITYPDGSGGFLKTKASSRGTVLHALTNGDVLLKLADGGTLHVAGDIVVKSGLYPLTPGSTVRVQFDSADASAYAQKQIRPTGLTLIAKNPYLGY
jgi:hypothetical protein